MEGKGMSSARGKTHIRLTAGIMIIRNRCCVLRFNSLRRESRKGRKRESLGKHILFADEATSRFDIQREKTYNA